MRIEGGFSLIHGLTHLLTHALTDKVFIMYKYNTLFYFLLKHKIYVFG